MPGSHRRSLLHWAHALSMRPFFQQGANIMDLWHAWIDLLQELLQTLAVTWGLGTGLAIIALTATVRLTLLPLSWSLAYRAAVRQSKMVRLKPMLDELRE